MRICFRGIVHMTLIQWLTFSTPSWSPRKGTWYLSPDMYLYKSISIYDFKYNTVLYNAVYAFNHSYIYLGTYGMLHKYN